MGGNVSTDYGAPARLFLDTTAYPDQLSFDSVNNESNLMVNATLTIIDKPTTRTTESACIRFAPGANTVDVTSLEVHKVASWVDPRTVAENGSKHIHYMSDLGARWHLNETARRSLQLCSLDAGLVTVGSDGRPVPTLFSGSQAGEYTPESPSSVVDLSPGMNVQLWNNLWQTNYVFWCAVRAKAFILRACFSSPVYFLSLASRRLLSTSMGGSLGTHTPRMTGLSGTGSS